MSHWFNHDAFAIDRHARRHLDRQHIWNVIGSGIVAGGTYLGGKAINSAHFSGASFSAKYSGMPPVPSRKRSHSVYAGHTTSGRPTKRRRTVKRKTTSAKKTYVKKTAKRTKRTVRRTRRSRKKSRKTGPKTWGVFQKLGILRTHETGVSTTGVTDAGFLGHASFRPTSLINDFMLVLLKTAYARAGIHMNNVNDVVPVPVGDGVEIYVRGNLADATNVISTGMVYLGGETWMQVAAALWADIITKVGTTEVASTMILGINLSHSGPIPYVRLNLIGSKIVVRSESWLKIQNQTVTGLGSEEDEVDRCPVLCNKYWGYGTGAFSNRLNSTEAQLVQNQTTGIITKVGTVVSGTSEAPPRSYFTGCKSKKQFVLAPGHFASSKAYFNTSVAIEKFWPLIASQYVSATPKSYYPYGSWNLFHFEHLIKPKAATANLIVNGEVNFRTGVYLTVKHYHATDERVDTSSYVTY